MLHFTKIRLVRAEMQVEKEREDGRTDGRTDKYDKAN
jgi:hypothetical protein